MRARSSFNKPHVRSFSSPPLPYPPLPSASIASPDLIGVILRVPSSQHPNNETPTPESGIPVASNSSARHHDGRPVDINSKPPTQLQAADGIGASISGMPRKQSRAGSWKQNNSRWAPRRAVDKIHLINYLPFGVAIIVAEINTSSNPALDTIYTHKWHQSGITGITDHMILEATIKPYKLGGIYKEPGTTEEKSTSGHSSSERGRV
ncbi:hypothetical protein B0H16DRAFT_1460828 [Mycena metata]|uniref:Uncharacterized protein n=1 Tax=Mycena metata TaxID=1033252 RepID=A0AAD7IWR8_9AGAR|nr:hypothetical protein B0H16DRAFT_1460828 [Mycena metata]